MHEISTRSPERDRANGASDLFDGAHRFVAENPARLNLGTSPLRMCRSVPQIVTASTRTMASCGSASCGSATSSHECRPGP